MYIQSTYSILLDDLGVGETGVRAVGERDISSQLHLGSALWQDEGECRS